MQTQEMGRMQRKQTWEKTLQEAEWRLGLIYTLYEHVKLKGTVSVTRFLFRLILLGMEQMYDDYVSIRY